MAAWRCGQAGHRAAVARDANRRGPALRPAAWPLSARSGRNPCAPQPLRRPRRRSLARDQVRTIGGTQAWRGRADSGDRVLLQLRRVVRSALDEARRGALSRGGRAGAPVLSQLPLGLPRARAAVRLPDSQGPPRGAVGRLRGRRAPSRRRPPRYIQSLVEALLWPLATVAGLAGWREANDPNLSAAPEARIAPPRRLAALPSGRARPGRQPRRLPHAPRHISLRRRRGHHLRRRRRLS